MKSDHSQHLVVVRAVLGKFPTVGKVVTSWYLSWKGEGISLKGHCPKVQWDLAGSEVVAAET
jgi:hypothetical protein